jgi:hypothetical protein
MCYQGAVRTRVWLRTVAGPLAVLVAAAGYLVAAAGGSRAAVTPSLYVTYVGTNCTFTITNDQGSTFTSIAPGSYQIFYAATDFESCTGLPAFQLTGPGVSIQTPIDAGTGDAAESFVTFQPSSTYVAQDLNQPLSKFTFTTLAAGNAPPVVTLPVTPPSVTTTSSSTDVVGSKTKASSAVVFRGVLHGTVSSSGKATLTFKGKAVGRLLAGKYTLTVVDHSKAGGFIVQQLRKAATTVTGVPFVGRHSITIVLAAGQSLFYPTFLAKKSYFFVVAPQ